LKHSRLYRLCTYYWWYNKLWELLHWCYYTEYSNLFLRLFYRVSYTSCLFLSNNRALFCFSPSSSFVTSSIISSSFSKYSIKSSTHCWVSRAVGTTRRFLVLIGANCSVYKLHIDNERNLLLQYNKIIIQQ